MTDSADIKMAQANLDAALRALDSAAAKLGPKMAQMERQISDSGGFREDRARLAEALDLAKSEAEAAQTKLAERETQFQALASESQRELEAVIGQVRAALTQSPSEG